MGGGGERGGAVVGRVARLVLCAVCEGFEPVEVSGREPTPYSPIVKSTISLFRRGDQAEALGATLTIGLGGFALGASICSSRICI